MMTNEYIQLAIERGIITDASAATPYLFNMITAETYSRIQAEKALMALDPSLKIRNVDQWHIYDLHFKSGETKTQVIVEAKARNFNSDKYSTVALSAPKYDNLLEKREETGFDGEIWYVSTYVDGVAYIFDLVNTPVNRSRWKCHATTARPTKKIKDEECVEFPVDKAKYVVHYA